MSEYKSFTELEVWRKGRILRNEMEQLVKRFPPEEKHRLTDQSIRSVRSINANIAEVHGRFG
jgi:four helix bundle protein